MAKQGVVAMKRLLCCLWILAVSVELQAAPMEVTGGVRIQDLIETGVRAIPGCLGYCITGVCAHLKVSPYSVSVILSPRIAHNTPELTVSAYRAQGQQPWIEWREVFGEAQRNLAQGVFDLISSQGRLGGYGSYTEEHTEYDRQAPFKEVDINGHPLALLTTMLAQGGMTSSAPAVLNAAWALEQSSDDEQENNVIAQNPETHYGPAREIANQQIAEGGFPAVFMDPELLKVFSYADTLTGIRELTGQTSQVMHYLSQMQSLLNRQSGQSGGNQLLCPGTALPFTPYYLSAVDTVSWRIPWADVLTHAQDIGKGMLPFAEDRPVLGAPTAWPGLGDGTWGGLYPRMGFVRNAHDGKVASVAAQRALDLLLAQQGKDRLGHLIVFNPDFPDTSDWRVVPYAYHASGIEGGVWQAVYPQASEQCTSQLYQSKTPDDLDDDRSAPRSPQQNYVWAFWRRYECCMNRNGIFIGSVPLSPICVTGG